VIGLVDVCPLLVDLVSVHTGEIDLQEKIIHVVLGVVFAHVLAGLVVELPQLARYDITNVDADFILLQLRGLTIGLELGLD
jgi:hypothetical protein